ncbi:unnamed protein product [Mytilus coruscus]|uniref:Uncharacterized protein n=1 Tax=Mytilus coruscus TaxID=42192 RepID=A0A6J8E063_MYTCO|nr:unnamed protein product [Mytilus coruscus]
MGLESCPSLVTLKLKVELGKITPIPEYNPFEVLSELKFWLENVTLISCRYLRHYCKSDAVIYSDAGNIAAAAFTVELEKKIFHMMCPCCEMAQSSTWGELETIESIKLMIACKAKGTLVVPKRTSAAFWPLLFDKHLINQDYVKNIVVFKNTGGIYEQDSNKNMIFGVKPFGSPVLSVLLHAS